MSKNYCTPSSAITESTIDIVTVVINFYNTVPTPLSYVRKNYYNIFLKFLILHL